MRLLFPGQRPVDIIPAHALGRLCLLSHYTIVVDALSLPVGHSYPPRNVQSSLNINFSVPLALVMILSYHQDAYYLDVKPGSSKNAVASSAARLPLTLSLPLTPSYTRGRSGDRSGLVTESMRGGPKETCSLGSLRVIERNALTSNLDCSFECFIISRRIERSTEYGRICASRGKVVLIVRAIDTYDQVSVYCGKDADSFVGYLPGSRVLFQNVHRRISSSGNIYLTFHEGSSTTLLSLPHHSASTLPAPSEPVPPITLFQVGENLLSISSPIDQRCFALTVTLSMITQVTFEWRCTVCGGGVKNSHCLLLGCLSEKDLNGAYLSLEMEARAEDGMGTAIVRFGGAGLAPAWPLLTIPEELHDRIVAYVQQEGRLHFSWGRFYNRDGKIDHRSGTAMKERWNVVSDSAMMHRLNHLYRNCVPRRVDLVAYNAYYPLPPLKSLPHRLPALYKRDMLMLRSQPPATAKEFDEYLRNYSHIVRKLEPPRTWKLDKEPKFQVIADLLSLFLLLRLFPHRRASRWTRRALSSPHSNE